MLIIAELGTAHGADRCKARELIRAAAEAGADCVKFQMVYADEILHPETGTVPLPGGNIRLYDRFRELELPLDFFAEMKEEVEALGLLFLCTPFGLRSLRELVSLKVKALKIASPELNYAQLVAAAAAAGLPTYLSTGVSTLGDIEAALAPFTRGLESSGTPSVAPPALLHCVTAYPAPEEDYNLLLLESLGAVFGVPVGLSDHSLDPTALPSVAAALGACAVEKHFCLSRSDPGLDDPIALPPGDFAALVRAVRRVEAERESGGRDAALAAAAAELGAARTAAILGDGVKRLAASEKANYERTNRSLHALRALEAGQTLRREDIGVLRTEKVLRPGLPPAWLDRVVGRRLRQAVPAGEGIRFEDI